MTALHFHSAPNGSSCEEPGCNRAGRYTLTLCGYPVYSASPYATSGQRARICGACKNKQLALYNELSQPPHAPAEEHVERLGSERQVERVEAIDALRGMGWTPAGLKKLKKVAV